MFAWKNYIWSGVPIDVCPYVKNELKFSIFSWVTGVSGILESDFWYRNWVSLEVPDHNQEKEEINLMAHVKRQLQALIISWYTGV